MDDDLVYAIARSLWNPANRGALERLGAAARTMRVERAAENLPIALHPGASRFYQDAGR
jgi:hypothetical protein